MARAIMRAAPLRTPLAHPGPPAQQHKRKHATESHPSNTLFPHPFADAAAMTASQVFEGAVSPVGCLCLDRPQWVSNPPIEAVVFAWGASEDHQLGLDTEANITAPKVVEAMLGIQFRG